MTESKEYPTMKRLQGSILVPCEVQKIYREDGGGRQGTFYKFTQIKITDHGQNINDPKFVKKNYRQLRREYILHHMPQHEQNEAIVEYYNGDDVKMQKLVKVKSKAKEFFPK